MESINYSISILLGVISGVFTSILIYFIVIFYKKIFLPWVEVISYKGIVISGKWNNRESKRDGSTYQMILDIQQNGYNIKGTFFAGSNIDKSDINYYFFSGQIINEYIVANYKVISRSKLGMGAFLLRVCEGGESLLGTIVFVDEEDMSIITFKDVRFTKL